MFQHFKVWHFILDAYVLFFYKTVKLCVFAFSEFWPSVLSLYERLKRMPHVLLYFAFLMTNPNWDFFYQMTQFMYLGYRNRESPTNCFASQMPAIGGEKSDWNLKFQETRTQAGGTGPKLLPTGSSDGEDSQTLHPRHSETGCRHPKLSLHYCSKMLSILPWENLDPVSHMFFTLRGKNDLFAQVDTLNGNKNKNRYCARCGTVSCLLVH